MSGLFEEEWDKMTKIGNKIKGRPMKYLFVEAEDQ
jgi:hypothetical protein